jgi:hypothetical protein
VPQVTPSTRISVPSRKVNFLTFRCSNQERRRNPPITAVQESTTTMTANWRILPSVGMINQGISALSVSVFRRYTWSRLHAYRDKRLGPALTHAAAIDNRSPNGFRISPKVSSVGLPSLDKTL